MNDLISRQAVLGLPRSFTRNFFGEIVGESINVKEIEDLPPAQPEPQWISCSERLPNSQTEVIVSCRYDSADTIYRYTASGWITTNGEYWIVDNEINPYVVAWMPLPEPWKGVKE